MRGNTVELTAGNGDRMQLFGPGHRSFEFYRSHDDSTVSLLEVDDLDQARPSWPAAAPSYSASRSQTAPGPQGSGVFRECPHSVLIEALEAEGFGGGGVVAAAFGDVQVAGVFDSRDDGGADGGQVDGPAAGPAGGGIFAETHVADVSGAPPFVKQTVPV